MISAALGIIWESLKAFVGIQSAKNAPDVKAAAIAAKDQSVKDKAAADVASGNLDQIRRDAAE